MLATTVLASGITHLTDARYFAAWEVDYLAFPLGEGAGEAISWDYLNALREWVEGPEIVAELGSIDDGEAWLTILTEQKIKTVLLYEGTSDETAEQLHQAGIKIIRQLIIDQYQKGADVESTITEFPATDLFLLQFEDWITYADLFDGSLFGLEALNTVTAAKPCLLQLHLGEEDPKVIKDKHPIAGFAVRGSSEEKVGYKSFDDLDGLFEGLEVFE
ncbi:MAG: hypothetical protein AAF840_03125 [Bacteroidota bacterium]